MKGPVVFGCDYSVYVRSVRLTLEEKGVGYQLVPIDVFAMEGVPASHLARHPFGKIPTFEHGDFRLYETGAIIRYIDEAFAGQRLQAEDLHRRARANQVIGIADNYAYPDLVWGIYVERVSKPAKGLASDEARIAAALPKAATCLDALARLLGEAPWFGGPAVSLADLHLAPMVYYALKAPEARNLIARHANLSAWWERIAVRPSMSKTVPTT